MEKELQPIKLIKNTFFNEKETKESLAKFILNADVLSMGQQCRDFEINFSQYYERNFTTFVNSGSSANLALIQSLINLGKLKKGDEVAFSAVTWSTNVMPLIQLGLIPKPIDVDLRTLNVSSNNLKSILSKTKPRAFFITNLLGFCDDIDEISEICNQENIILIEDNCESFGSEYRGKLLGNFGLASTFSFFVGHHLSAIEGGAVCCDNEELNDMLALVRAHGWDRNLSTEKQKTIREKYQIEPFYDKYSFYDLGYNLRPNEINGFLANKQLEFAEDIIKIRNRNFLHYDHVVKENNSFLPFSFEHMDLVSNFAYPIICKTKDVFNYYVDKFISNGVEIRPIVGGNMLAQPFYKKYNSENVLLPNADAIHQLGFYFPNNPTLTDNEIDRIIKLLK